MTNTELANEIIDYVLAKTDAAEFTEMRYTLKAAKAVLRAVPYYNADDVIDALFGSKGGETDAE